MKAEKLREFTKDEIAKELGSVQLELKNSRFSKAKGEDKNPIKRRSLKKTIARILTIKKEKGWN